ncbi:hypothetical protein [Chryseobacterium sp. ERMR1:04]|uniref:hypothetical protein n=1 Tax=Chryseobacterium sp. ERMR1:04 TaxID=1705393 RepID=UPI0006C8A1DA|nr:hypothetical protein [Chryseobacterium sp. ERMR1:04]KPH14371.1 hypothetical protein AMQ68_02440 [Chryseobacterium sp. ERMR1:04]
MYTKEGVILTNTTKAFDYANVKDLHSDMMARYVWVHHVELEAHFAPVAFINRPEIFNLSNGSGKRDEANWPINEGSTIWDRIQKTAKDNGDIFYRVGYGINFFNRNLYRTNNSKEKPLKEEIEEKKKDPKQMKIDEKNYVKNIGKELLINPQIAYNAEVEKWINIAKLEVQRKEEQADREREKLEREIESGSSPFEGPKF